MSSVCGGAGGDALYATLYAGGCGGWAQFRAFEISIVEVFSLQSATKGGMRTPAIVSYDLKRFWVPYHALSVRISLACSSL